MPDGRTHENRARYSGRRAFLDAVAMVNIIGIAITEVTAFPEGGIGLKLYSAVVIGLFIGLWLVLRRYEYPVWLVLVLQLALLGHLAGRLVTVGGVPFYRTVILGVPSDKTVHAFNAMAGAAFLTVFFRRIELRLRGWEGFVVTMVIGGCGALIEIIEYGGVLVLPSTHVGDYANNAQDLVANLVGAVLGWALVRLVSGRAAGDT